MTTIRFLSAHARSASTWAESTISEDRRAGCSAISCVRMKRSKCGRRTSKSASYQWNLAHMPLHVRPFLNTFYPSLPIPDHFFEDITAFSVFTHIDEPESPWLLELRQVLSPKGVLCLTIHDELFWERKPVQLLETLQRSGNGGDLTEASPFPGERSAFHFTDESHYSCNVFHSKDYVRRQWGRFFDIVKIGERDHGIQCLVALTYEADVPA